MAISVTELKHRCLEVVRRVERTGKPMAITRRGRVVASLEPTGAVVSETSLKPWQRLRGSAVCLMGAGESVLEDHELEALR